MDLENTVVLAPNRLPLDYKSSEQRCFPQTAFSTSTTEMIITVVSTFTGQFSSHVDLVKTLQMKSHHGAEDIRHLFLIKIGCSRVSPV